MDKYGIAIDQMSAHGSAAAQTAERTGARTIIYREKVPIAAVVPMADVNRLDPVDPMTKGHDPLLTLCGACQQDMFVESMISDLGRTRLFQR